MSASASPSPFTRRVERRFEVKKSNSGVEEEEAGRKNIKDKIRMVRMVRDDLQIWRRRKGRTGGAD